jgi:hypothetical protein
MLLTSHSPIHSFLPFLPSFTLLFIHSFRSYLPFFPFPTFLSSLFLPSVLTFLSYFPFLLSFLTFRSYLPCLPFFLPFSFLIRCRWCRATRVASGCTGTATTLLIDSFLSHLPFYLPFLTFSYLCFFQVPMVSCDTCGKWVHGYCDPEAKRIHDLDVAASGFVGGATALVTFLCVLCTLRTKISRSICTFTHHSIIIK